MSKNIWVWVYLPMIVGTGLIIGAVAAILLAGQAGVSAWADVSLIFLVLPLCLGGIVVLGVLVGVSYGLIQLIAALPAPVNRVQNTVERAAGSVGRVTDVLVRPAIVWMAFLAALREVGRWLGSFLRLAGGKS